MNDRYEHLLSKTVDYLCQAGQALWHWIVGFLQAFSETRLVQVAAALSFTSLLSLIPLVTVALSIVAAFPSAGSMSTEVQAFVFDNFVPSVGGSIQGYVQEFATKAAGLTLVGLGFCALVGLRFCTLVGMVFPPCKGGKTLPAPPPN